FALLTGAPPFAGPEFDNVYKKFKAHEEVPAPPISPLCPDVPPGLADLIRRMLEKDSALRPSPAEVAREVLPFCAGHDLAQLLTQLPPEVAEAVEPPPAIPQLKVGEAPATAQVLSTVSESMWARRRGRRIRARVAVAVALIGVGGIG